MCSVGTYYARLILLDDIKLYSTGAVLRFILKGFSFICRIDKLLFVEISMLTVYYDHHNRRSFQPVFSFAQLHCSTISKQSEF